MYLIYCVAVVYDDVPVCSSASMCKAVKVANLLEIEKSYQSPTYPCVMITLQFSNQWVLMGS